MHENDASAHRMSRQHHILIPPLLNITVKPIDVFLDACAKSSLRVTGQIRGISIDKMLLLEIPDSAYGARSVYKDQLHYLIQTGFSGAPDI
jgi:hypothetical protein